MRGAWGLTAIAVCGLWVHAFAGAQEAREAAVPRAQSDTIRPTVLDVPQPGAPAYRLHAFRVPLAHARVEVVDTADRRSELRRTRRHGVESEERR